MRAMAIQEFGGLDKLKAMEMPRPRPGRGELLIRIVAAGVNPVDCAVREGAMQQVWKHALPLIPGFDAAGVVEEFGDSASRFRKGDRVWASAIKPTVQWGCYAEYVSVPESSVALMPSKLLFEEAAAYHTAALTAYQALFQGGTIESGTSVLVHAGAGGVGHFAIQLARNAGGHVYTTASSANHEFVLGLGARAAIDYHQEDPNEVVRRHCPDGVDLVVDTVGGAVTAAAVEAIKPEGRLVSIVQPPDAEAAGARGIKAEFLSMHPNGEQLSLMAQMVDAGRLRTNLQKIYALADAAEAQNAVSAGHVRGKLVLNL